MAALGPRTPQACAACDTNVAVAQVHATEWGASGGAAATDYLLDDNNDDDNE